MKKQFFRETKPQLQHNINIHVTVLNYKELVGNSHLWEQFTSWRKEQQKLKSFKNIWKRLKSYSLWLFAMNWLHWVTWFSPTLIRSLWDRSAFCGYMNNFKIRQKQQIQKHPSNKNVEAIKNENSVISLYFQFVFLIALGFWSFNNITSKNEQIWRITLKPRYFWENP